MLYIVYMRLESGGHLACTVSDSDDRLYYMCDVTLQEEDEDEEDEEFNKCKLYRAT